MELDIQSWNKLEAEFRKKVCAWAEFNAEEAKRFQDESSVSRYLQIADASSSTTRFEQQWKRSIGDTGKNMDIAEALKEASSMFRKPHRLIHTAMAYTRAELKILVSENLGVKS